MKRSSAQQNYTKELVKRLRTNVETGKDIEKSILSIQNDHLSNLVFDLEQNILNLRREKQDLEDESKKLDDQLDKAFTFAAQLYNKPKEVLKKSFQKNIDYDNDKFIPFPELFDELADREGAARLSKIDFEKLNLIFKIESLNYKKELEAKEKLRVEAKIQKKDRRIGKLADNLVNYGFPILKDFGDKAEKESSHGQSQSHPEDSINSTVTNTINGSLNTTTNLDLHRSSPIDGENETKRSKKEQLDLLKKRQEEINSYTKQIEELKRKIHETQQITKSKEHKNQNSSETKDFIAILTTLKTDYLKFRDTYDQNRQELSMHWLENFTNLNKIKMEDANCQKNFKTQIIHYEQRNLKLKRENDALKLEIEKIQAGLNHGETIKKETRQLIESYKENIKTMQSQIDRNREISDKFKKILEITEKEEVELKQQEEAKKMKEEEELKAKEENLIKRVENYKNELLAKKEAQSVKIENDENQDGKDEKEVKVEASETVDEVDRNRSDSVTFWEENCAKIINYLLLYSKNFKKYNI